MLENGLRILLAIAGGYVLGSLPTAFLIGKLRGKDLRQHGSGNLGATNAVRVLGWPLGLFVLAVDVTKGILAVALVPALTPYPAADLIRVACGLAAVIGHTYPIWLRFKGGKGVATTYGVFLALAPISTILVFLILVVIVASTRYVSAGSLASAVLLPMLIWITGESGRFFSILLLAITIGAVLIYTHRSNLARLLAGTESRLGSSAPGEPE